MEDFNQLLYSYNFGVFIIIFILTVAKGRQESRIDQTFVD